MTNSNHPPKSSQSFINTAELNCNYQNSYKFRSLCDYHQELSSNDLV